MNQKPSVVQILKSVPQVLTSDTSKRKAAVGKWAKLCKFRFLRRAAARPAVIWL